MMLNHSKTTRSVISLPMADPAWGIWGKCPQPCGGASHASD